MTASRIRTGPVLLAAVPYVLMGYPWFSAFRDPWFYGGGLTVEQLREGPGYGVAFGVAIVTSLVMAFALAWLVARTGPPGALRGTALGAAAWAGFVGPVLATQYTFEARSLAYFGITAGYPLLGLLVMGAIVGAFGVRAARTGAPPAP